MTRQLLKNVAFTDSAGATFTSATFQLSEAKSNPYIFFKINGGDFSSAQEVDECQITCRFAYWISETERTAHRDEDGLPDGTGSPCTPYWLVNMGNMDTWFNFDGSAAEYSNMTLEQKCMHYLENTILAN